MLSTKCVRLGTCKLDRFIKKLFLGISKNGRAVLSLIDKQMLEKVFCSNIVPCMSSVDHLFHKAKYMGRNCFNQVWAITFDWRPEISIPELHFESPIQGYTKTLQVGSP